MGTIILGADVSVLNSWENFDKQFHLINDPHFCGALWLTTLTLTAVYIASHTIKSNLNLILLVFVIKFQYIGTIDNI